MMYTFGDMKTTLTETLELVEEIVKNGVTLLASAITPYLFPVFGFDKLWQSLVELVRFGLAVQKCGAFQRGFINGYIGNGQFLLLESGIFLISF